MAVVTLMGIDGCGKSTLSKAVVGELQKRGQPAVARWATLRPVLLVPFIKAAKFLLVRKHPKFSDYAAHTAAKREGMKKLRFAHSLYFLVLTVDYLPQAWWKVGLPRLMGRHVICDRYYQDLALDYAITVNGDAEAMMRALDSLQRFVPAPDLQYFVGVPPAVAFSRKDDVPSIAYLEERDRFYRELAQRLGLPHLDGTARVEDSSRRVLDDIENLGALKP